MADDAVNASDAHRLREAYTALPADGATVDYVATGHAHSDLVWLWTELAGEAKAVHTFATMNRLIDIYRESRFAYSQPASYAAVGRRAPAMLERVKERIAEGRWEATGASEVGSDTILSCGEALARRLIVGQRRFRELRGEQARTLWLPDVFGYWAALPRILLPTGVTSFNRFPTAASSGAARMATVICYVSQDYGYNCSATPGERAEAGRARPSAERRAFRIARSHRPRRRRRNGSDVRTYPSRRESRRYASCALGRHRGVFAKLETKRAKLPVYQGEHYLEYHRGVYTSISRVKAAQRACKPALQTWETVRVALGRGESTATDTPVSSRKLALSGGARLFDGKGVDGNGADQLQSLITSPFVVSRVQARSLRRSALYGNYLWRSSGRGFAPQ